MNILTETQKAYIAGIVDGEGCISIYQTGYTSKNGNKCYSVLLRIVVTNKEVLGTITDWVGLGHVQSQPLSRQTGRYSERCKPLWKWQLSANKVREFLPSILPFLQIKKEVAKLALELLGNRPRPRGWTVPQGEINRCALIAKRARELNQRGVHVSV